MTLFLSVCVCRAAYASSSDGFPVSYQCLICQGKLQQVCVCVCVCVCVYVFCQSAYHSVFNEQKHAVPCRLAHSHQLSLSSILQSPEVFPFFLSFFFFPLKLFLPPPHPNHSWLNQLQNEVKQLHVAKLLM